MLKITQFILEQFPPLNPGFVINTVLFYSISEYSDSYVLQHSCAVQSLSLSTKANQIAGPIPPYPHPSLPLPLRPTLPPSPIPQSFSPITFLFPPQKHKQQPEYSVLIQFCDTVI